MAFSRRGRTNDALQSQVTWLFESSKLTCGDHSFPDRASRPEDCIKNSSPTVATSPFSTEQVHGKIALKSQVTWLFQAIIGWTCFVKKGVVATGGLKRFKNWSDLTFQCNNMVDLLCQERDGRDRWAGTIQKVKLLDFLIQFSGELTLLRKGWSWPVGWNDSKTQVTWLFNAMFWWTCSVERGMVVTGGLRLFRKSSHLTF